MNKEKDLSLEQVLKILYKEATNEYKLFIENHAKKSSVFFYFIKYKFSEFIIELNQISESDLTATLKEFEGFQGNISKVRFLNLIKKITREYLTILGECYRANQVKALLSLENLLGNNNRLLKPYLVEQLINYCTYNFSNNPILFRIRDENKGEKVDNCWHTPFFIRQNSYTGRFSMPGFPCLYLADSPSTCNAEIKGPTKGKDRWLAQFSLKKGKNLICLDLRIPTTEEIERADSTQKIQLLLTYPLRLLCSTTAQNRTDGFGEEYLFSQALMNVISFPLNDESGICSVNGVVYNSTKRLGGINYALPAKSNNIPPSVEEIYSTELQELFTFSNPQIIIKGDINFVE